jgi:hypothetical protein
MGKARMSDGPPTTNSPRWRPAWTAARYAVSVVNQRIESKATLLGAWASVVAILSLPLLLAGAYLTFVQVRAALLRPDVVLRFYDARSPTYALQNPSEVLAREIRYQFVLLDMDDHDAQGRNGKQLAMPSGETNYIRPLSGYGATMLESREAPVPDGHVVFGIASVSCSECERSRAYWVYYKKGVQGWYSEIQRDRTIFVPSDHDLVLAAGRDYQRAIDNLVPERARIRFK